MGKLTVLVAYSASIVGSSASVIGSCEIELHDPQLTSYTLDICRKRIAEEANVENVAIINVVKLEGGR